MHPSVDLLSSIGICITAAAVLAIVASKLQQPLIVAYLLAGVVIGPQLGLGWIPDNESIHNVAEIGLILLLFLIGMELDLKKLVAAGKPVILTGILQFLICAGLGLAFFAAFGFRLRQTDFGLFYLAVCLALSSTMIVVKLLYEKLELDTLAGRITLGVLVFQDIWAIVILAIQPNLLSPRLEPLLASMGKSTLLLVVALAASRWFLPPLFRSVAKQPEVLLAAALAWCFAVCGGSSYAGLSREMGALVAGVSLSAFPYNFDVIAKVISLRDFFVTLFFVALGMQIPAPTTEVVGLALLASIFLVTSRFLSVFPLLRAARLGHRASLLPAINLSQISEFSLVIASLGVAYKQIDQQIVSALIFVFVITSVASTYLIGRNDTIARRLVPLLTRLGLPDIGSAPEAAPGSESQAPKDILLLGFHHQASALIHEWEGTDDGDGDPALLSRILVVDFNPQVHEELKRRGISCLYGDLASMETLHHAQIDHATLILLTIPDSILRGTSNQRLLKQARRLRPEAKVVATADRVRQALQLYQDGADYVFLPHLQSARDRARVVEEALRGEFDSLRADHIAELRRRDEVLA
ncbi:MAG: cation:proton antiporter [Verrucomicrobiota bacterium]